MFFIPNFVNLHFDDEDSIENNRKKRWYITVIVVYTCMYFLVYMWYMLLFIRLVYGGMWYRDCVWL